jgi:cobalt/nickel transport system ATP-binding protein
MDSLLRLEGIRYTYPGKASPVLRGACLELTPTTRLGLTGVNGGGKSTLLHVAAGLLRPEAGTIAFKDAICRREKDFAALRLRLGYLLQHAEDQLFCPTVLEDVAFGPYNQGHGRQEAERIARATLERMDLSRLAGLNGSDLSGGEKRWPPWRPSCPCGRTCCFWTNRATTWTRPAGTSSCFSSRKTSCPA